ncbi:hypothetical protein HOP54_12190 [Halomonas daqingensis]|uniref:DUF4190 domain-containing protein n=1 Tax=Billgrantia desiderata TaxID=52021 RepID=A0AAW4Z1S2_9GAMM|nr:hypothetical protein [Halomonas desiderata]MCE8011237.1 hypothetical protein [Halomonas desiderata]MCE8029450.1 hypothetical protein [Halomonas desiderata]MCE8053837.1 hypothetical protein [Halomonas desiderata]OUE42423.1 hypothetical protein BZY95_10085 [Halomonas desiderata SP1]SEF54371.1 hypothetical protein SAMN04487953_102180 [Halomonas desiderata]
MERDISAPESPRRRYAPWAMTAIVTALVALLFQGSLPPLNIAAAIFALMGLRQIRRHPDRYIGRAFCWLAIALVLILAILTAMLQPPMLDDAPATAPEPRAIEAE